MDLSNLKPLIVDKQYSECFQTFKSNADEDNSIIEWINGILDTHTGLLSKSDKTNGEGQSLLRILGIGSGDGKFEVEIILQLLKRYPHIECTVIEPSAERIESYKKRVKDKQSTGQLSGVLFHWRQEYYQDFCEYNKIEKKTYHFISAIHSLYFLMVKDVDIDMKNMLQWLKPSGKFITMLCAGENNVGSYLRTRFLGYPISRQSLIHTGQLIAHLDMIRYKEHIIPAVCNITECLNEESVEGRMLLDFMLGVAECREHGPPEITTMIMDFFNNDVNIIIKDNYKVYAKIYSHVVIFESLS